MKKVNCDNCIHISITEEEQHRCNLKSDHRCLLHNDRLLHNGPAHKYINPCALCKGVDYIRRCK